MLMIYVWNIIPISTRSIKCTINEYFPIDGLEGQNKYPSVEVRNLGLNNINSFDVTFEHGGSKLQKM